MPLGQGARVTSRLPRACIASLGLPVVLTGISDERAGIVGSCCGLGMRIIPELSVGRMDEGAFLADAIEEAEAERDPTIAWEGLYAHRCQACVRLYRDPAVRSLLLNRHVR